MARYDLPWRPHFPAEFLSDTQGMSLAEKGAFTALLDLQWRSADCLLPEDDDKTISKVAKTAAEKRVVSKILEECFPRVEGGRSNQTLKETYEEQKVKHQGKVEAGRKGGTAKAMKNLNSEFSNATARSEQSHSAALATRPRTRNKETPSPPVLAGSSTNGGRITLLAEMINAGQYVPASAVSTQQALQMLEQGLVSEQQLRKYQIAF